MARLCDVQRRELLRQRALAERLARARAAMRAAVALARKYGAQVTSLLADVVAL